MFNQGIKFRNREFVPLFDFTRNLASNRAHIPILPTKQAQTNKILHPNIHGKPYSTSIIIYFFPYFLFGSLGPTSTRSTNITWGLSGGSKTIILFSNFSNVKEKNTSIILGRIYYLGDELVDDEVGVFVTLYWTLQKRQRIKSEI
jgi:hypothetical protein